MLQVQLDNLREMTLAKREWESFEVQDSLANYRVIADDYIQTKSTCILSIVYIFGIKYNIKTDVNLFHLKATLMCNCNTAPRGLNNGERFFGVWGSAL